MAPSSLQEIQELFPFPLSSVTGQEAEAAILRRSRSDMFDASVIIGDFGNVKRFIDAFKDPFDVEVELKLSESLDLQVWFEERRQEMDEFADEDEEADPVEIYPEGTTPMTMLTVGFDHQGNPKSEIFIATFPTKDAALTPFFLHFGDWNSCPPAHVHVALARCWQDRYGARIVTIASDIIEFIVDRPPSDDSDAARLANEQYLYCPDIVDQGVGSVATLAKALRHSTRWYFWWD